MSARAGRLRALASRSGLFLRGEYRLWLALPVLFNVATSWHVLRRVSWPNDVPFHVAMTDWAAGRWRAGTIPLDGWFPRLSGGLGQFHVYQSLPHQITAIPAMVIGADDATNVATFVLWCTWPISVFIASRMFRMSARAALVAACLASLLHSTTSYGFEVGSYSWTGYGLWSQLWGMWVFPLALAATARAVAVNRGYLTAAVLMALLAATHLPSAWFAFLMIACWVMCRPTRFVERGVRSLLVGTASVLVSSWVLVPLVSDQWSLLSSTFNSGSEFVNSFGWRRVLPMLARGQITDAGRVPVVALAAVGGLVVCAAAWRRVEWRWPREIVVMGGVGLVLFIGRDPFGPLIDLLPGSKLVFLNRYNIVVQLAALLLAGVAVEAALRRVERSDAGALARPVAAAAALGLLWAPAAWSSHRELQRDRASVTAQARADKDQGGDLARLVAEGRRRGGARFYAGRTNNWGEQFKVGAAPVPIVLAYYPVDAIGYNLRVAGLTGDLETYLNDMEIEQLRMLGISHVIVPSSHPVAPGLDLVATAGVMRLYEVPHSGWVETANVRGEPRRVQRDRLGSTFLTALGEPTLQGANRQELLLPRMEPGAVERSDGGVAPGEVTETDVDSNAGRFGARVDMKTAGVVVFKANWNPRFEATVDGKAVPTIAVNPFHVAVPVSEGTHRVSVNYRAYSWYWLWFIVALAAGWVASRATLVANAITDRLVRAVPAFGRFTAPTSPGRTTTDEDQDDQDDQEDDGEETQ